MEQSVPKRRHIKFRRRGITQKKTYSIQNTVKVWNQEYNSFKNWQKYSHQPQQNEICCSWPWFYVYQYLIRCTTTGWIPPKKKSDPDTPEMLIVRQLRTRVSSVEVLQKGLQVCLSTRYEYIDHCSTSWPHASCSITVFGYKDYWSLLIHSSPGRLSSPVEAKETPEKNTTGPWWS